jgi:DNA-binding NarL/FixJ family response regulator
MSSARQLAHLLDLGAEAVSGCSDAEWWPSVAAGVTGTLFAASVMAINVVNPDEAFGWFRLVYPDTARLRMPVNSPMDEVLVHDHPFSQRLRAGPLIDPIKVTDLLSDRQWRDHVAYERMRYLTGGTNHLIIHLPRSAPYVESVSIVRPDRDFDANETQLAMHLQTVVQLAARHFRQVERRERRWGPLTEEEAGMAAAAVGVTARERTVLDLLAAGASTRVVAARLGISTHTVYRHEQNLYRKLQVSDALNAVLRARQLGLLPVHSGQAEGDASPVTCGLTRREQGVLQLLATGMTNPSIAEALMISPKTVDAHVATVLRKLDARTRTEAVGNAFRRGLVS